MKRIIVYHQGKAKLQVGGLAVAIVTALILILSICSIYYSVQYRGVLAENQKLTERAAAQEQELLDVKEELEKQELLVETLSEAVGTEEEETVQKKCAYLTFDDGPHPNTEIVLDLLKERGIPATFFVNGRDSDANIATYTRIVEEGHVLANHTYSHAYKEIYASTDAFMQDIHKLEELILNTTGYTMPRIVRFPGGSNNTIGDYYVLQNIKETLKNEGYRFFDWNVSGEDAVREGVTASEVYEEVLRTTKGKETPVILLHCAELADGTIEALPDIIDYYLENGFEFCTLDSEEAPEVVLASINTD